MLNNDYYRKKYTITIEEISSINLNKSILENTINNNDYIPVNSNLDNDYTTSKIRHDHLQKMMKSDFNTGIEHWLHQYQNTYRSYFVTFTFREPNYVITQEANKFFEQMVMRMNNKLCVNNHRKSAVLILYPEYERKKDKLHYHGVMLVHRNTSRKFSRNCISHVDFEKLEEFDQVTGEINDHIRTHIRFTDYIAHPYTTFDRDKTIRKRLRLQYTPKPDQRFISLSLADYRVYKTPTFDDFKRSFKYSQKHFYGHDLEYENVMVFKKAKKNPDDRLFARKRAEVAEITKNS